MLQLAYTPFTVLHYCWSWNSFQLSLGKRLASPWSGYKVIVGIKFSNEGPLTCINSWFSVLSRKCMSLVCDRKPENPQKNHADVGKNAKSRGIFLNCNTEIMH